MLLHMRENEKHARVAPGAELDQAQPFGHAEILDVETSFADQEIERSRREERLLSRTVAVLAPEVPDVDPAFRPPNIDVPEAKLSATRRLFGFLKLVVFKPASQRSLTMADRPPAPASPPAMPLHLRERRQGSR